MPKMTIRSINQGKPYIEVESEDGEIALKVPKKDISYNPIRVGDVINLEKISDDGKKLPFKFQESDRTDYIPEDNSPINIGASVQEDENVTSKPRKSGFDVEKMKKMGLMNDSSTAQEKESIPNPVKNSNSSIETKSNTLQEKAKKQASKIKSEKIEVTDNDLLKNTKFHHTILDLITLLAGITKILCLILNNQSMIVMGITNILLSFSVIYGLVTFFNHRGNLHRFSIISIVMLLSSLGVLLLSVSLLSLNRMLAMIGLSFIMIIFAIVDNMRQKKLSIKH